MNRLSIVIVIIALSGCSTTGKVADGAHDRYVRAANSWLGAPIGEMIAAWGDPTRRFLLPEGEKAGIAWWESLSEEGGCGGGCKIIRFHCSTVTHFNSNLTITGIEIKHSRDCYHLYENRFESMTRDRVKLDPTHIEI